MLILLFYRASYLNIDVAVSPELFKLLRLGFLIKFVFSNIPFNFVGLLLIIYQQACMYVEVQKQIPWIMLCGGSALC
jgi:hypothetical protein